MTASSISRAHVSIPCLKPETQTAGLFCRHAPLLTGRVFVVTRFNRTCDLIGRRTAVTHLTRWTSLGASAMSNQTDWCLLFYTSYYRIRFGIWSISLVFKGGYSCFISIFIDWYSRIYLDPLLSSVKTLHQQDALTVVAASECGCCPHAKMNCLPLVFMETFSVLLYAMHDND